MSFIQKHRQKLIVVLLWLIILGSYWEYSRRNGLSPAATAQYVSNFLQNNAYGPLIFLTIYLVRPLVLFPTAIMTIMGGFLFGPILGVIYVLAGNVLTAAVAYVIGYYLGQDVLHQEENQGAISRYADYLRRNNFEAVLVMRLMLLNFDFVSYLSGFLRINLKAFLWATVLGSIAGTTAYVLAGSSVEGTFTGRLPSLDPWMLGLAALLFLLSFVIAWYLRRQKLSGKVQNHSV